MMPNARLLDIRRFSGKDDAVEATRAVSRLEAAIPKDTLHPSDIPRIMAAQRAFQAKLPKEARVSIGGEIQMHHLEQAGYKAYRLGQFEASLEGRRLK